MISRFFLFYFLVFYFWPPPLSLSPLPLSLPLLLSFISSAPVCAFIIFFFPIVDVKWRDRANLLVRTVNENVKSCMGQYVYER